MILEEENEKKTDKVTDSVTESCDMESHFNILKIWQAVIGCSCLNNTTASTLSSNGKRLRDWG